MIILAKLLLWRFDYAVWFNSSTFCDITQEELGKWNMSWSLKMNAKLEQTIILLNLDKHDPKINIHFLLEILH